jgi:methanol--5-hydroxybenzimidazolylcobamide Co-methyltransferase
MCDLWSNESVQNVRLLSGSAPEAFTELLAYDCRLMNQALKRGEEIRLRDWLTESDEWLSPQAAVLSPEATIAIARAIVSQPDDYRRTLAAGRAAVKILRDGLSAGKLTLAKKELTWLDRIENELEKLPEAGDELMARVAEQYKGLWDPASYGFPTSPKDPRC